jgi:hypothetical protein
MGKTGALSWQSRLADEWHDLWVGRDAAEQTLDRVIEDMGSEPELFEEATEVSARNGEVIWMAQTASM